MPLSPRQLLPRACFVLGVLALGPALPVALRAQSPSAPAAAPALDQLFKQGADAYVAGRYDQAIALFDQIIAQAKPSPTLEPVHFTIAAAKLRKGDHAGAIESFRAYLQLYPAGAQLNDARAGLTTALINSGRMDEARAALVSLSNLRSGREGIDNYALVLGLTLQVADSLLEAGKHAEALPLLQQAPDRARIIAYQTRRVRELAAYLDQANAALGKANALGADSARVAARDNLASRLANARSALTEVEAAETFDLPRLLRQARCHLELDQPWHAIVLLQDTLDRFPASPDRAYALHCLVVARDQVGPPELALRLAQDFIAAFPGHALLPDVAAIAGQLAIRLDQTDAAIGFFGSALQNSQGNFRESLLLRLGDAYFSSGAWKPARETLERYVREFPTGEHRDNATYRAVLTWFLANDYESAEPRLKTFLKDNPSSAYRSDAAYRLAVCRFAYQEYAQTIQACADWEKQYPTDGLVGEVRSLKADAHKALAQDDDALEAYILASSVAASDQVLGYTLDQAAALLEKKRDWTRLDELFSTQLARSPDSPLSLGWVYWIARAKARAGDVPAALEVVAGRIALSVADPSQEDVERLLLLVAQLQSRRRIPAPEAAAALRAQLAAAGVNVSLPLVHARLRLFESRLLTLARKPAEASALLASTAASADPDTLSVALLAELGEALARAGDSARAAVFFNTLLARHPSSPYRDYAYVGLGDLALARGEAAAALASYADAIDRAGAAHRLREATVGRARALFALGRLDEAAKLFESIAASREWRGEATALSLYHLGLIAARQGDLAKAHAFFQRVYVGQGRHLEWVAKSYLEGGDALEKLGKPAEAAATYREMLRNERLADRPELATARERLARLEPASS